MSFTARYAGPCASEDCSTGRIAPGQEVEYNDEHELMHVVCSAGERHETLPPLCQVCHLHHRGECP